MNRASLLRAAIAVLVLALIFPRPLPLEPADAPQSGLPLTKLQAGSHLITAQLALTPRQQQKGLMFRRSMRVDEGMLFVFQEAAIKCFWMMNTYLPLTLAFIEQDGSIVSLHDMHPRSFRSNCSTRPVRYVLEMNQGWFAERGVKVGARLSGQPFVQ